MCRFKNNLLRSISNKRAFTMVEVVAAVALLSAMLGSVMVLMNRYVDTVIEMQLREQAFELARGNMEQLLAETKLSDMTEFGTSETNPDIEWQTVVEPFYEPITDQMWVRAVCSASFNDNQGEFQNIELEHWITNLTAAQVKQILAQQQIEEEYLELLQGGEVSAIQETTIAYLKENDLDSEAYERFAEQQKQKKLEYITENGFEGYEEYLETLAKKENEFLEDLGMNFDGYNKFAATYVPVGSDEESLLSDINTDEDATVDLPEDQVDDVMDNQDSSESTPTDDYGIDWSRVPPELIPLIEQLLGIKKP